MCCTGFGRAHVLPWAVCQWGVGLPAPPSSPVVCRTLPSTTVMAQNHTGCTNATGATTYKRSPTTAPLRESTESACLSCLQCSNATPMGIPLAREMRYPTLTFTISLLSMAFKKEMAMIAASISLSNMPSWLSRV